jgi:hypothetical protein
MASIKQPLRNPGSVGIFALIAAIITIEFVLELFAGAGDTVGPSLERFGNDGRRGFIQLKFR